MTTRTSTKRAAIYCRCSTDQQDTQLQKDDLTEFCRRRGWAVYQVYEDKGISGTKDSRPALDQMVKDAHQGKFDVVLVWRFDRYGRSTAHLLNSLNTFRSLNVDFVSLNEALDTTTPSGRVLFTIIAAIAEFERAIIVERVRAGVKRAQANGVKCGRPRKGFDFKRAVELRRNGQSLRQVARQMGVSLSTLYRAIGRM
jgi:DNA invertase Pin-like site-specific DNA recombinase